MGGARCTHPSLLWEGAPSCQPSAYPRPLLWGQPPAVGGGAGCSRLHSHGRSEQSPGVANSGHGQLCSGAEAVISGPENSCPEWAPRRAVIFPGGPSWPCAASPSKVQGCEEPSRKDQDRQKCGWRLGPPAWGGPFRALRCSQREPRQSCDTAPSGKLEIREGNKEGWNDGGGLCGFTCRQEHSWVGAMGHQVTGGVSTRLRGLHTQASCGRGDQRWRPGTYHSVPP